MRQKRTWMATAVALTAFAGCGGDGGESGVGATLTTTSRRAPPKGQPVTRTTLVGDWLQLGTVQQVRFGRDGTFAMDYNRGDLDNPSTAAGTYDLREGKITFTVEEVGLFCVQGDEWMWDARVREGDLHIEWVESGCGVEDGTRWTLTPIHR